MCDETTSEVAALKCEISNLEKQIKRLERVNHGLVEGMAIIKSKSGAAATKYTESLNAAKKEIARLERENGNIRYCIREYNTAVERLEKYR